MKENHELKLPPRFAKTRLSEAEYQALLVVLRGLGTTRSRLLRRMIREVIDQGPDLVTNDLRAFREATFQVGAVGRNFNQLVRAIHSGQADASRLDNAFLGKVWDAVTRLEKELLVVIQRSRQRWVNHG